MSVMSACACLPSQTCPRGPNFRSNFSRPEARNLFEFPELFAIALCIYMESSFWRMQINT
jgi:hypothetical protein